MSAPASTKSKFHDIEVIYLGWVEPNNGRLLEAVDIKINGKLVTDRYFMSGWNHLAICNKYQPDSPDGRFFFLPKEGSGILIDTSNNFSVIGIGSKSKYSTTVIGNTYFNDRIFVVNHDEVVVMHLPTLKKTFYEFNDISVIWVSPIDDHQFELSYYDSTSDDKKTRVVQFT